MWPSSDPAMGSYRTERGRTTKIAAIYACWRLTSGEMPMVFRAHEAAHCIDMPLATHPSSSRVVTSALQIAISCALGEPFRCRPPQQAKGF